MPADEVRALVTGPALRDLEHIYRSIAEDSGIRAADAIQNRLRASVARLERFPESGTPRPRLAEALRSVAVGSWVVWYTWDASAQRLAVLRVLHAAMDSATHLRDLPPA